MADTQRLRRVLKEGVSITALCVFAAPAVAQTAGAPSAASAGQDASQEAGGTSDAVTKEIIVTGRRAALQSADQRKKNAEVIIDSVVADEAGKLPDNSITEVLQRVSGVAIVRFAALGDPDHFSVEGSGVQVRGLSGVASRLNGREVFGANGGRSLLWGDVTPELMAAVDVYKSSSADQIEGGTGGSIDLRTKMPFDYKRGVHFAASGNYSRGDLVKKNDYDISGLITGNWDTGIGRIGVLVDAASSKLTSLSNFIRMEPYYRTHVGSSDYFIPGGYDYGDDRYKRNRSGIYAAVQWSPSSDLEFTSYYFQSRYHSTTEGVGEFVTSQTLGLDPTTSVFDSGKGLLYSPNLFQRDTGTFLPNGASISAGGNTGVSDGTSKTREISNTFKWTTANGHLAIRGGFDNILAASQSDGLNLFRNFSWPTNYGLDLRGKYPTVTLPSSFSAANFLDPTRYTWSAAMPHNEDNRGLMNAVNLDAEWKFDNSFIRSVEVGGRWARRTERDFSNGYAWTALGAGWNQTPVISFANTPNDIEAHTFGDFFHGQAVLPGVQLAQSIELTRSLIHPAEYAQIFTAPPVSFCGAFSWSNSQFFNGTCPGTLSGHTYGGAPGRTPGFILPQDQTDYTTVTKAGYIMTRFGTEWGPSSLTGNAGLRVVKVENSSFGFYQQGQTLFIRGGKTYTLANKADVVGGGAEFTKYLPAINVNYSPVQSVKIRAAYNITMDNASFGALRASGGLGVSTTPNPANAGLPTGAQNLPGIFANYTTTTGNPKLKPVMSNNYDLSFEWYPRSGTTFHMAAFYKHITNLYIYSQTQQPVTAYFADGTTENAIASATDVKNADKAATVKGIEIGGRLFLDRLPGLLKGLGVEANYTYIDSKNPGDLYYDINSVEHHDATMQGLSKHNYNATLLYEHDPFSLRVAYSWRSRYLQSTNANGTNPTYQYYAGPGSPATQTHIALPTYGSAYGQVDAGIYVKVNPHLSVNLQGTNILNATQKTLMGGYEGGRFYVRSWFQSDRRFSIGANVNF